MLRGFAPSCEFTMLRPKGGAGMLTLFDGKSAFNADARDA
jgi:hypothetical protein